METCKGGAARALHQDADDGTRTPEETTAASVNHKQTFTKRRNRIILCMCLFLLILSIAYTSTDRSKIQVTTHVLTKTKHSGRHDHHCVIHVHGFHHSGTGFLRKTIYDSLGHDAASMHEHTSRAENEGQYIQQVYPPFYTRTKLYPNDKFASLYYCPEMLSLVSRKTRALLFQQWSRYWNMTSSFLIQKTPTLDVLFLEKMKTTETVHVIVMREPFSWRTVLAKSEQKTRPGLFSLCTWLQVWGFVLGILSNDSSQVKSFAIVNYEALVEHGDKISHQLSTLIQDECGMHVTKNAMQDEGRRLPLRVGNSSQYLVPSDLTLRKWKFCESNPVCHELMDKLTPVIAKFGYSWDRDDYYMNVDSKLLYSSNKRPPRDISEKMKELTNEYCTLD